MPRSKSKGKTKRALEAKEKKAKKNKEPLPKLKLRILPPKTPVDAVPTSPGPAEKNPAESPQITPPTPVPPKVLRAAVAQYMVSKGYDGTPELESEDDDDELEELMKKKGSQHDTLFSDGMVDELEDDKDLEDLEGLQNKASPAKYTAPEQYEDEDESEDEEKGESESDGKSVNCHGAITSLTVSSDIKYTELLSQLADTMSLLPKAVHVAYRFSTQPRSDPFSHLLKPIHLIELVQAARRTQNSTKSKKEFKVELKDLEAPGGKGKGKAAGKDGKKDKKKRKRRGDSDSEDSDDDDVDKVKKKKKSMPQLVAELQEANACTEHGGDGCLKYTTGHVPLMKQDLSTWAIFLAQKWLYIYDDPSSEAPGRSEQARPHKDHPSHLSAWFPTDAMPGMPPIPFGYHPYQWPVPQPWSMYQTPAATPMSRGHYQDVLSSPPEVVEDSRLFPRIGDWLQELNDGPRGVDEHNFAQFAADFDRERYVRVVDLERLKIDELKSLIPEIAHGTASKLLAYATADIGVIRKQARKRARKEAQSHGPRYT
ncbi:hypothetical protein DFH07DRAFT_769865 [Mycena maculata]|uniref:Uncharacterized protein n=1 Tax=Mycena maculata TaxID=230809 RepID=A0AAD7JL72_9AGAR|nr:hypothetical protein DFH07DRAFT_769865 [Mycena maculata]